MRTVLVLAVVAMLGCHAMGQVCVPYFSDMGRTSYHFSESFFAVWDGGSGPALYRGDNLDPALIHWTGAGWEPFATVGYPPGFSPYAPLTLDLGSGQELCLTGSIGNLYYLLRWNREEWQPTGVCVGNSCSAYDFLGGYLQSVDLGSGPAIYAAATHPHDANTYVVRWDSTHWTDIGAAINHGISALVRYDDGSGPALFALGDFMSFSGVPALGAAKWNGVSWSAATPGSNRVLGSPRAVAADLGDGPALYTDSPVLLNGGFRNGLNRWNGEQWANLGSFTSGGYVSALAVFDDGSGPALYVGGRFSSLAGVTARNIVRYTPTGGFEPLAAGVECEDITELWAFQDRRGPALYIGGDAVYGANGGRLNQSGVLYIGCPNCYVNCDLSTTPPVLNVNDFVCFMSKFAANLPEANCDNSTTTPTINVGDFMCFIGRFAEGCR